MSDNQNVPGVGTRCFICRKMITQEDCDPKARNRPMKMMSIPGFVHRKCKIIGSSFFIGTETNVQDLTNEIDKL
jgi:hypothetical protein